MIPLANPKAQYYSSKSEVDAAIDRVLTSGQYILGREVKTFETRICEFLGLEYGVGVSSGTEALRLALIASGVESGDEIIAPSHTAVATIAAIVSTGAVPIFVDIEDEYFTIDCELISAPKYQPYESNCSCTYLRPVSRYEGTC